MKHLIKFAMRSIFYLIFLAIFYFAGSDLRFQVAIIGAMTITAVLFDAEKWELK